MKAVRVFLIFSILLFIVNCTKSQVTKTSTSKYEQKMTKKKMSICKDHEFCQPLREFEAKCREEKKEKDCKNFVLFFEKLAVITDCTRSFDKKHIVPSIWLCDQDSVEASYPKLAERSANTLSQLKFSFAQKFYRSKEFRSILDGELAEQHRQKSLDRSKNP